MFSSFGVSRFCPKNAIINYDNHSYSFNEAKRINSENWRIPTIDQWIIFAGQLDIVTSNYSEYGLKVVYWSSSGGILRGKYINFARCEINSESGSGVFMPVRLLRLF